MKCEYCDKDKKKLFYTFRFGFICWKCLNEKTIGKQKCINPNCLKEFDLKKSGVMRKDRCNACFQYFKRNNRDRTQFPEGCGGRKGKGMYKGRVSLEDFERKKELEEHLRKLNELKRKPLLREFKK